MDKNGDDSNSDYVSDLLRGLRQLMYVRGLAQGLQHGQCLMTYSYHGHCHLSNGWRTSCDDWSSRLWIKMESLPSTASLSSPGSLSPFKEFLGLVLVNVVSGSEAVGERTVWHPLSKQKIAMLFVQKEHWFGVSLPPLLPLCPFSVSSISEAHSCCCGQGKAQPDRPQKWAPQCHFPVQKLLTWDHVICQLC